MDLLCRGHGGVYDAAPTVRLPRSPCRETVEGEMDLTGERVFGPGVLGRQLSPFAGSILNTSRASSFQ